MAHFEDTTQAKYWLFTLEQVKEIRTKCNQEASNRFRERVNSTEIEPVKLEEEAKLRRIYEIKIQKYSEKLGLPEKAQATAVTLFKRYFLRTSVMEADLSSIS
jgi:cyclin H